VWAHASYQVARIYLVNRDGRRIDGNDYPDWRHFVAAAYADELVVNDRRFAEIVNHCPPPKPSVVTFETWARDVVR
jgi:hypothetical protein